MDLVMEFSVGERVRVTIGGTYDGEIAKVHSINSKSARLIQSDNSDPTEQKLLLKTLLIFLLVKKLVISGTHEENMDKFTQFYISRIL